jgi:hypothetical protein
MTSEALKRLLVQSGLYDNVYNLAAPCINRPFRERTINVLHDRKLIFVHNPKCAGTSIKRVLGIPTGYAADHRIPAYMVHRRTWEEYFSFVVVRNPFERLVSSFTYHTSPTYDGFFIKRYPHLKELDLKAYFELMRKEPTAIRPQVDYVEHKRSDKSVDRICRMEHLAEDLSALFRELGIEAELPHENRTEHKSYREYFFDDDLAESVQRYYRMDMDRLGYAF